MSVVINSVANPIWADPEHNHIRLNVEFEHLKQYGPIPFNSAAHDTEAHGRELFERALSGEFGPVAEFDEVALYGPRKI